MKHLSIAVRFAILVSLVLAIANPPTVISQKSSPQAVASGRRIFNQSCAACHDTLGTATKSGTDLKSYYHRQPRPADASVRTTIQQGKGKMPAFSTLNQSQLDDLVAYLKTL